MISAIAIYGSIALVSLLISIIHLIPSVFRIEYRWKWWAFGVSFLGALYSASVAVQFVAPPNTLNLMADRVAFASIILTLTMVFGLANTYFRLPLKRTFLISLPVNLVLVLLTLATDWMVVPLFEMRYRIPILGGVYWEAGRGVLQSWTIYYLAILGFWGVLTWFRHRKDNPVDRPVRIGILIWLAIIVADIVATSLFPDAPSIQAFGFISFSLSFVLVSIRHARDAHEELMDTRARADAILASSPQPVLAFDGNNRKVFSNPRFDHDFGAVDDEQIAATISNLPRSDASRLSLAMERCREVRLVQEVILTIPMDDGGTRHVTCSLAPWPRPTETSAGVVMTFSDVSDLVLQVEERTRLASHDSLTGLLNRHALEERLSELIHNTMRNPVSGRWAVFYMDLDRFKPVNDTWGHHMGDQVLLEIAGRIRSIAPRTDLCFRIGGDEFLVVIPGASSDLMVINEAEKIRDEVKKEINIGPHTVSVGCSIGITIHPEDGMSVEDILANADTAMYRAKKDERSICFFSTDRDSNARRAMTVEANLQVALKREELLVVYQPVVDREGGIRELEALVRWQDSRSGMALPGRFLPALERTREVEDMEKQVFQTVSSDAPALFGAFPDLRVGLNVSSPRRAMKLSSLLDGDSGRFSFEFSEEMVSTTEARDYRFFRDLKDAGFGITVDDFGRGDMSIALLSRCSADKVKLLVSGRKPEEQDPVILQRALLSLASGLGLERILLGVENPEDTVAADGDAACLFQGFLFHRPMSLDEILKISRSKP